MLIRLKDCTVKYHDEILFRPESGVYDMVIGKKIISAYAGSADNDSFPNLYKPSKVLTNQPFKTEEILTLEKLYSEVRELRSNDNVEYSTINTLWQKVKSRYPSEWLLILEILEISKSIDLRDEIILYLKDMASRNHKTKSLIIEGLEQINNAH